MKKYYITAMKGNTPLYWSKKLSKNINSIQKVNIESVSESVNSILQQGVDTITIYCYSKYKTDMFEKI